MQKGTKIFFIIIFFILLGMGSIPVALNMIVIDEMHFQIIEKRPPTKKPTWSWKQDSIKSYFKNLDLYLDDMFPFRKVFTTNYSTMLYRMGVATRPNNLLFGKNGFLFAGNNLNEVIDQTTGKSVFKGEELDEWINSFATKQLYLNKLGIEMYVAIAPNKHSIYPENLPSYIIPSKTNRLQQIVDSNPPFNFINTKPTLLKKKREWSDFYLFKKTDTHWTSVGAYFAYLDIIKEMQVEFKDIKPVKLGKENFKTIPDARIGDIKGHLQITGPEEAFRIEILKTKDWNDSLRKTDFAGNPLPYNSLDELFFAEQSVVYNDQKPYTVLFFEDSFSYILAPFFNQTFGKVIYIHYSDPKSEELAGLIDKYQPDIVLYEMCERQLHQKQKQHPNIFAKLQQYEYQNIFDLSPEYLSMNSHFNPHISNLVVDKNGMHFQVIGNDPIIILPKVDLQSDKSIMVKIGMTIPENTITELFYTTGDNQFHNSEQLNSQSTLKGRNTVLFYIDELDINGEFLRFDPGLSHGKYTIHSVEILYKE